MNASLPAATAAPPDAAARWDLFVVLAEMRTGSNLLEANINAMAGARCHGEAFNARFVGAPDGDHLGPSLGQRLGVSPADREADPLGLIGRVRDLPGLNGFRLFGDHDARAGAAILADPRCAKVVLTRNPAETYVSRKIAEQTDVWRLTNPVHAPPPARARFDAAEFAAHLDARQAVQLRILRALQVTGQAAFFLDYEDIQDEAVMAGLAAFLGVAAPEALNRKLKKQNPEPLSDKVENFADMAAALGGRALDRHDLSRTPSFEPRRGPGLPNMVGGGAPILFMPVRCGPDAALRGWLAGLGGMLTEGFNLKTLRSWKAARPGHLSITALRHPLARAHAAFCAHVLSPGGFEGIRNYVRRDFRMGIPEGGVDLGAEPWGEGEHQAAFLRFLAFLKMNLNSQTSVRVDAAWASQLATVQGFAALYPLDLVLREERLPEDLGALAARLGLPSPPVTPDDPHRDRLAAIYGPEVEAAARDAMGRDYMAWGFSDWRPAS